jgi:hypothetical protein
MLFTSVPNLKTEIIIKAKIIAIPTRIIGFKKEDS